MPECLTDGPLAYLVANTIGLDVGRQTSSGPPIYDTTRVSSQSIPGC